MPENHLIEKLISYACYANGNIRIYVALLYIHLVVFLAAIKSALVLCMRC